MYDDNLDNDDLNDQLNENFDSDLEHDLNDNYDFELLAEYEKMLNEPILLDRKVELIKLQDTLNRQITELDDMIAIYSTLDFVRVGELMGDRIRLNNALLDVLSESNELYLESIRLNNKTA
jgi:hypothetical protein